jgi:hypothetical protein
MADRYKPGDAGSTISTPGGVDSVLVEEVVSALTRLFEGVAVVLREGAQLALIESETKARIEKFRTSMALLEKQLERDNAVTASRQQSWFALADKLIERGEGDLALKVLEMCTREGRPSLIQPLIDYHEKMTLGLFSARQAAIEAITESSKC